jgi:lipopolysaccharide export system permease protein
MKALDKYILKEFLAPLLLVVFGLASLVTLVEFVDKLPRLREWHATGRLIFLYHLTRFPFLATQVLPIGVMLATLIALGGLARNSELIAARAGGVSSLRLGMPILGASLLISLLLFAGSETVMPRANYYSHYIEKVLIEKRDMNFDVQWKNNMAKSILGDRQLYAREYDGVRGAMKEVVLIQRQKGLILERYDARQMIYDADHGWKLIDGVERTFDAEGDEKTLRHFTEWPVPMTEKPVDFMVDSDKKEQDLLELSIQELSDIIKVLKETGADYRKELVCLNVRISYPFSCFILALLGVALPFLFPSGRRALTGAAMGFLVSVGCGMLYLVLIQIGLSLGKTGSLPILLAAWLGNITFLAVGGLTLWKVNR